MRALCTVLLLTVLATGGTGCAIFGKKEGSSDRHGLFANWFKKKDSTTNPPPPKFPDPLNGSPGTPPPIPPTPTAQTPAAAEAQLAGQVLDAYSRPASNTFVRVVQLDGAKDGTEPVDVKTIDNGYFTVPGLKSGGQYQLFARTKQGDKLLAGIAISEAPNSHVVIQVREGFAPSSIPPMPDPAEKKETKPAASSSLDTRPPATAIWTPAPSGPSATVEVEIPTKLTVPAPSAAPSTLAPGVASAPNSTWPPPLQIGPKKSTPPPAKPAPSQPPPALPPPNDLQSRLPPKVPSCVVVASRVQTLALKDVDEQTWNFHKDRKGRVVLLDFWIPGCAPCQQTMPILSQMQMKYGPQGLEVVGIYLDSGPVRDQAKRAKQTCFRLQTNYRQLLGQNDKTQLREQFNLQHFPTMILLDAQGHILWREHGVPNQAVLEQMLQKYLAPRAF